jgi:hypothetical protein
MEERVRVEEEERLKVEEEERVEEERVRVEEERVKVEEEERMRQKEEERIREEQERVRVEKERVRLEEVEKVRVEEEERVRLEEERMRLEEKERIRIEEARVKEEERVKMEEEKIKMEEERIKLEAEEKVRVEEEERLREEEMVRVEEERVRVEVERARVEEEERVREEEEDRIRKEVLLVFAGGIIVRWFRAYHPLLRIRKMKRGFQRLQALYRAYSVRARNSAKVMEMLRKIKEAEERAIADPTLILGRQTQVALQVLQSSKMISQQLRACVTLQLSTQLSPQCSEAFAKAGASGILFALIRSCNRSLPHQELLRCSLLVLLNVARYRDLTGIVSDSEDSANTLVDLMQMFRDKKVIFGAACELLCRLIEVNVQITVRVE